MDNLEKCYCTKYLEKDDMLKLSFSNETYIIYGNLNKGEKIILKYFGKLTLNNESKIFLNYGYGNLWNNKNVLEMAVCWNSDKMCYCVELELINIENMFFCFMDDSNNWDLNENSSYMLMIDTPITTLTKKDFAVALSDDEYMTTKNKFFKKISDKLIHFFDKIGRWFNKKIKV